MSFRADTATRDAQTKASDPRVCAWVSANAGSGKTTVLTKRVKRLLLMGVEPSRILCLTFTKAAAANMANRVLRDLADWVALDDEQLRASIAELEDMPPARITPAIMARARRIFATALETPGGLKIQTIHAFCDALLHQFPFEAGVSGGFRVLDDMARAELIAQARERVIHDALSEPDSPLGRALVTLTDTGGEERFTALLDEALHQADLLRALFASSGFAAIEARINAVLDLPDGTEPVALERQIIGFAALQPDEWPDAIATLSSYGPRMQERADALRQALQARDEESRRTAYFNVFRKQKGGMYSPAYVVVKALGNEHPALADKLLGELSRLGALDHLMRREKTARVSRAVLVLAYAVLAHVEARKARIGLLDFPDLVARAARLLASNAGDWVRWKLDRGIDHILVDEAQDTSIEQWSVVTSLAAEFFAGESAAGERIRTLFAVGDDKQSIFSFQGAKPELFAAQKARFAREAQGAGQRFNDVKLHLSFRSAPQVLAAVDAVFARAEAAEGVTFADAFPPHAAARQRAGGLIELWPATSGLAPPRAEAWDHPLDEVPSSHARIVLANKIADQIRTWLDTGESIDAREGPRPMTPGDILVLVRTRNPLFAAIIRALKDRGVPVSGADRLTLVEHIAVMDLMALGDHILLPQDDLTLACLLKSPLIGLDDADLTALGAQRSASLSAALAERAHEAPRWQAALERISHWRTLGLTARPYDFYARVLGADGGRVALLQRLGREAADAIDEFLNAALAYEAGHTPSLQGFLVMMRRTRAEVKREMDQGADEVRVMTAHNAKGLEARVVILPDTASLPDGRKRPPLMAVPDDSGLPPVLLFTGFDNKDIAPLHAAREAYDAAQAAEYRRLLYVALTRAEDRLLIAGAAPARGEIPPLSWYGLIADALLPSAREETDADGTPVRHVWPANAATPPRFERKSTDAPPPAPARPDWAAPAPPLPQAAQRLAPSKAASGTDAHDDSPASQLARARGTLLHRLLQDLPAHPAAQHEALARRYLANNPCGLDDSGIGALIFEALDVLAMPLFAPDDTMQVFAELPVTGRVRLANGSEVAVSGQIDRLVVGPRTIEIIDYKTGRPPRGDVPESYAAQMALYAQVLGRIFPDRQIRAALLWTAHARLQYIEPERLAKALAALGVIAPAP